MSGVAGMASGDPATMLNAQLASALSTMGDAQFWEENISPHTIRTSLASSDPSNINSTPALLKGMKWLLASISKGRDVSDFYPHVVKLVGAHSLEVRKMVYMFLVQYADHDATTRELSLLSINSFQRGLADSEQLIRALALRVLTSIRIPDILQIQILGVQKCAKDKSPYVRKCAANALAKLNPRCNRDQHDMLLEIMKNLLDADSSTMVLSSTLVAFAELCPERLELLHACFRKVCHLLTDMDEWGQVVAIDTFARYCRKFFREPRAWKEGTAERIDRERRVKRTIGGISLETKAYIADGLDSIVATQQQTNQHHTNRHNKRNIVQPRKIKRRVVKKGFYSDEEDASTEEEVYADGQQGIPLSVARVMRQRNIMGVPGSSPQFGQTPTLNPTLDEDDELDEDHRLLLRSAMPLLKSRNSGVVLAVCSLQYYCGVSSVKVRSAIGKALVRIHRDRREIQYVVLTSIRTLVHECPSAFAPFLQDFFVMAMDPSFTRLIKLDILTSLALEPAAIEAVLNELRTYVRHGDKTFACAAIQAVGAVVELARIVYDRHGLKSGNQSKERRESNRIALNCLYGLVILSKASDCRAVVGECVMVMQRILLQLCSDDGSGGVYVEDPNHVKEMALRRILLLLTNSLSARATRENIEVGVGDSDDEDNNSPDNATLDQIAGIVVPPAALAAALWTVGEWIVPWNASLTIRKLDDNALSDIRVELCRLIVRSFPALEAAEKEQAVTFATKLLISSQTSSTSTLNSSPSQDVRLCETILAMGRVDTNPDVRDRARHESHLLHISGGLHHDMDALESPPSQMGSQIPTLDNLRMAFLQSKPASSSLPLEEIPSKYQAGMGESGGTFRFGTLSSIVGHKARTAYLRLPPWADRDSASALRDPLKRETAAAASATVDRNNGTQQGQKGAGFYEDSDDSSSSSSENDSDSSSDVSSADESTSSSYDGDVGGDDESSTSEGQSSTGNLLFPTMPQQPFKHQPHALDQQVPATNHSMQSANGNLLGQPVVNTVQTLMSSGIGSSNDDSSSTSESSDSAVVAPLQRADGNLIPMGGPLSVITGIALTSKTNGSVVAGPASSMISDFQGMVLEPMVVDASELEEPSMEKDSSAWMELVRPEHGGGLSINARYLRGKTKNREVQLLGLTAEKPSTVCLQLRFENKRTDGGVIRRVRVLQRSSAPSSSQIFPKKVVVPGEIASLKQGQMSLVILGIDFAAPSDRDGNLSARFDIKFSSGSIPVELRPHLGHVLQPCKRNKEEFEAGMAKLQGFHRIASKFNVRDPSAVTSVWIRKHAFLTPILGDSTADARGEGLRMIGSLPESGDAVFVRIACTELGEGAITVCCGQALAVNGIMNVLKKSLAEGP